MKIKIKKYNLELKNRFTISNYSRTFTPSVLIKLIYENFVGFGEATLPQYLPETQETVIDFLQTIDLSQISPLKIEESVAYLFDLNEKFDVKNNSAIAAVDIALHDLAGKLKALPISEMFKINTIAKPTSFTIGLGNENDMKRKILTAEDFTYLKIKIGTEKDREVISNIRRFTDKPLFVDANSGWNDKSYAAEMADFLYENNVLLIEQPFPIDKIEETFYLKEKSRIPIIADESIKNLADLQQFGNAFSGINIKLMKSGGLLNALKMINYAKEKKLKIMIGCMTETSCGISAAAQIMSECDFVDLDGNLLINNDPFVGVETRSGLIKLNKLFGLGIELKDEYADFFK